MQFKTRYFHHFSSNDKLDFYFILLQCSTKKNVNTLLQYFYTTYIFIFCSPSRLFFFLLQLTLKQEFTSCTPRSPNAKKNLLIPTCSAFLSSPVLQAIFKVSTCFLDLASIYFLLTFKLGTPSLQNVFFTVPQGSS